MHPERHSEAEKVRSNFSLRLMVTGALREETPRRSGATDTAIILTLCALVAIYFAVRIIVSL